MPTLGLPELVVILMIVVLVFGASRLPQLGETLGKTVGRLKKGMSDGESNATPPPPSSTASPASEAGVEEAEVLDSKS